MEFILNLLYVYVALYSLYFLILALRNLNDKPFQIEKRYVQFEDKDNIAVVIYSHNNKNSLSNLVNQLKLQDYPINSFRVFALMDNCSDGSVEMFLDEPFVNVINIKDVGTIGKDQAVSILLEQLSHDDWIDSYLFIDADRSIDSGFLSTVNAALTNNYVLSGETLIATDKLGPVAKVKAAYQKYHMNFMRKARSLFGLASRADSGVFIIKKDIVNQIGSVDFKDINTELKYSLLLSNIKFKCTYNPNIQTIVESENYVFEKPRLSVRLNLFQNCFTKIWSKNWVFAEHTMSLLYPNIWFMLIAYAFILRHSYEYYFFVDFKIVLFTFILYAAGFGISLINSRLSLKEMGLLALYPLYSFCHIINNLPPIRKIRNKLKNIEELPKNTEKMTVDVIVSTTKHDIPCKLEFISENGLAKVKFIYKNKKFTTTSHLRVIDALQELKLKLDDYGFILKICNCCSHYTNCVDGSTNMIKGFCNSDYPSPSIKEPKPTLMWNTCPEFTPAKLNNIIQEMVEQGSTNQ